MSKVKITDERVLRRAIPRLQTRNTTKSTAARTPPEAGSGVTDTAAVKSVDDGVNGEGGRQGSGDSAKNPVSKNTARSKPDNRRVAKGQLSLQGPFNPDIVGRRVRKVSDESKRKRSPSRGGSASGTEKDGTSGGGQFGYFGYMIKSAEDFKPKRIQSDRDKKKCSIEFSNKINTKFVETEKDLQDPVKFTARSIPSTTTEIHGGKNLRARRSGVTRQSQKAKPKGSGNEFPATGNLGLHKNAKALQDRLRQLEEELAQNNNNTKEVSELRLQLQQAKEAANRLWEENGKLKCNAETRECIDNLTEKMKDLLSTNQTLQSKLENCQRKLDDLDIDPVTLQPRIASAEQLQRFGDAQTEAKERATKLREKLLSTKEQNKITVEKMKKDSEVLNAENHLLVEAAT